MVADRVENLERETSDRGEIDIDVFFVILDPGSRSIEHNFAVSNEQESFHASKRGAV
jgi:hypothetical protein